MREWFIGLMGVFFLAAAVLQYNDPDPYLWAPLYGMMAYGSFAVLRGWTLRERWLRYLSVLGVGLAVFWMVAHWEELTAGKLEPLWECLGLLTVAVWSRVLSFYRHRLGHLLFS